MERKASPLHVGVYDYFKRALLAVSRVSRAGNDKWNPGQALHWSKGNSTDHQNALARHAQTPYDVDPETGELHLASVVWRAAAWLEVVLEALERDLCTLDDLRNGCVTIQELAIRLGEIQMEARNQKSTTLGAWK